MEYRLVFSIYKKGEELPVYGTNSFDRASRKFRNLNENYFIKVEKKVINNNNFIKRVELYKTLLEFLKNMEKKNFHIENVYVGDINISNIFDLIEMIKTMIGNFEMNVAEWSGFYDDLVIKSIYQMIPSISNEDMEKLLTIYKELRSLKGK